jgi:hypothetical protein
MVFLPHFICYILDKDLTFEELEQALGESNLKSAPSIDRYSNKFIKEFFYIIGCPLFNLIVIGNKIQTILLKWYTF